MFGTWYVVCSVCVRFQEDVVCSLSAKKKSQESRSDIASFFGVHTPHTATLKLAQFYHSGSALGQPEKVGCEPEGRMKPQFIFLRRCPSFSKMNFEMSEVTFLDVSECHRFNAVQFKKVRFHI